MSNLESRNKLTEFPALDAEEKSDTLLVSLSKFLWRKKGATTNPNALPEPEPVAATPGTLPSSSSESCLLKATEVEVEKSKLELSDNPAVPNHLKRLSIARSHLARSDSSLSNRSNPSPEIMEGNVSPFEARNLPNVLRRISNLIAMSSNNQADIKKYWMPDSVSKECYDCAEKFTTFRRKHHCRICGQIFCSRCCNQEIPGKIIGYSGDLRVCTYCCKIVLSYLQSADLSTDLTDELKLVQEDLQNRFGGHSMDSSLHSSTSTNTHAHPYGSLSSFDHSMHRSLPRRKASLVYQEERFATGRSQENVFDSTSTEEKPKTVGDWVSLKALWDDMCHPVTGIDWATHRHNMRKNFTNCAVGSELVDWLLAQRKISWRGQGVQIGQMLIDVNLIECVSQPEAVFLDAYALYRPVQASLPALHEVPEATPGTSTRSSADLTGENELVNQDPLWVKQIARVGKFEEGGGVREEEAQNNSSDPLKPRLPSAASLYSLDLNTSDSTVTISKPKEATKKDGYVDPYSKTGQVSQGGTGKARKGGSFSSVTTETMTEEFLQKTFSQNKCLDASSAASLMPPNGWHSPQQLTSDSEVMAFQHLCNAYIRHENDFLMQLLERMELDASWVDIILPIVHKVTEIVKPDVRHADDDMDIRQYIQLKKLPGGRKEDCRIVNGVVCTKNVAHRSMRHKLKAPKILFIGSSIDYQRFENRFLSLEPLVMQEYDYLKNTVARIAALSPDLVIVEKTVARIAQEFMLDLGITLVINTKASVMERAARSTQGVIESSADTPIGIPQLGLCHNFYTETFQLMKDMKKTLMFFDGCAMHLGCTVLLRGGTNSELVRVKKIMSLMIFMAYNWRLERSFHIDLFSMPPPAQESATIKPAITAEPTKAEIDHPKGLSISGNDEPDKKLSPDSTDEFVLAREEFSPEIPNPPTDPLQSLAKSEVVVNESQENNVPRSSFQKASAKVILSASPFICYSLPYLEIEAGRICKLRTYFPEEIYWSSLMCSKSSDFVNEDDVYVNGINCSPNIPKILWNKTHAFVSLKLTALDDDVQSLVADFRRNGNMLNVTTKSSIPKNSSRSDNCYTGAKHNNSSWDANGRVDALDPFKHQKISVLFCSFSPSSSNAPYFCVNPWVVNMDMYGRNDISLGMFLERYCFRKTYLCPARNCDTPMLQHIRRFAHEHGCVTVALKELGSPILGSGENILMWNWCGICKTVSPIVPMSVDAWSLSFAKYLELRFHGQQYSRRGLENQAQCIHSLNHDHVHYFAQHNIISSFKFSSVRIWEICLPVSVINLVKEPKNVVRLIEDVKIVAITGHGVYSNILEALCSLKETSSGLRVEDVVNALLEHLKAERSVFRTKIEDIQMNLTSPNLHTTLDKNDIDKFLWKITDSIGFLKSSISETIQSWNTRLQDLITLRKKEEKQAKASNQPQGTARAETDSAQENLQRSLSRTGSESIIAPPKGDANQYTLLSSNSRNSEDSSPRSDPLVDIRLDPSGSDAKNKDRVSESGSGSTLDLSVSGVLEDLTCASASVLDSVSSNDCSTKDILEGQLPAFPNETRPIPPPATEKVHKPSGESVHLPTEDSTDHKDKPEKKGSGGAVKTIISHFMSNPVAGQVIQSPWLQLEHNFPANLASMPIPVFENEPSSVVAFALSSFEYKTKWLELIKSRSSQQLLASTKVSEEPGTTTPTKSKDTSIISDHNLSKSISSERGEITPEPAKMEKSADDPENEDDYVDKEMLGKVSGDIDLQFNSSSAKFFCRVYFADKFRQLRKLFIEEPETFYIRSISRCISWAASGGKSGSTFCKTIDDRFVVKQMSKFEIQSFIDFAPNYFKYMRACYQEKRPTVLAKIVGVYRIGIKNSQTNSASKLDILIMENLFYQKQISQKFDLKGSIRNRLASTVRKDQEDLVLLDENLVNMACDSPLYIRPHTKTVLTMGLHNDSRFLSSQLVMDYSLLVGLDEQNNELVVGIIDYIRTFTWDKKIENFVKSSLGGQGKPTVVSPEEYQSRFCDALDRYFLLVPDRWMGLGMGVDS